MLIENIRKLEEDDERVTSLSELNYQTARLNDLRGIIMVKNTVRITPKINTPFDNVKLQLPII